MAAADFRDELRRLARPITIIQGDSDVSAPEAICGRPLAALLPSAEFLIYEGVAHGPMVTHVERLAADIADRALMAVEVADLPRSLPAGEVPTYAVAHLRNLVMGDDIVTYLGAIDATLAPFRGRFVLHGGAVEVLVGHWSGDLVAIEFPDRASAKAWYTSDTYQAILPLRRKSADREVLLIDAVEPGHRSTHVLLR